MLDLGWACERAVQFGPDDTLSGVLTVPTRRAARAPVILVPNTGASPRWGNARGIVTLARWLAESGIASMRIDVSGTGDAALKTGERGQPYSRQGDQDVIAGVEFLAARFDRPVIVLGMCSGAYHAFQAALRDRRIRDRKSVV